MTERININDVGNKKPEGIYITKNGVQKIRLAFFILIATNLLTSFLKLRKLKRFIKP